MYKRQVLLVPVIGLVAIGLFILIGYLSSNSLVLASGKDVTGFIEIDGAKLAGGLLNATYILLVLAILSVALAPIVKKFSN